MFFIKALPLSQDMNVRILVSSLMLNFRLMKWTVTLRRFSIPTTWTFSSLLQHCHPRYQLEGPAPWCPWPQVVRHKVATPVWLCLAFHRPTVKSSPQSYRVRLCSSRNLSKWSWRWVALSNWMRKKQIKLERHSEMKIINKMIILFRNWYVILISFLKWFFHQINSVDDFEEHEELIKGKKGNIATMNVLSINKGGDTFQRWMIMLFFLYQRLGYSLSHEYSTSLINKNFALFIYFNFEITFM